MAINPEIIPDFLNPRFVGKRLEGHSIPFELLGDLVVLEDMLIEVAKWQYFQANPERQRAPNGFADGVTLTLSGVSEGSAIAKIALTLTILGGWFPSSKQTNLEHARDAIVKAIAAAEENKSPIEFLPPKVLAYFDRLGRSLLEDEAIEFPTSSPNVPARLTRETRHRLLKASEVKEHTEEIHIRGGIFELNQEDFDFKIKTLSGTFIPGKVTQQHFDAIRDAFNGYRQGIKVLIDGIGKFNRSGNLQAVESVEHVSVLDPLDPISQLEELNSLKDGWLDGDGLAPSKRGLLWLCEFTSEKYTSNLPLPYVYPTADGGVRFEWSIGSSEVSLDFNLKSRTAKWHSLDLRTEVDEERSLILDNVEEWDWVSQSLQALDGPAK